MKGKRFILGSYSGAGGGGSVYFGRVEEEQTAAFAREVRPGQVIFDIGANVGHYSILASELIGAEGKVAAFEPLPRNIEYLQRHIELNNAANVTIMPFAVSDSGGMVSFATGGDSALGHIDGSEADFPVSSITVDEAADRLGAEPNIMKIDVEGAELKVLEGARRVLEKCRPTIFLSTHSPVLREQCLDVLKGYSYEITSLCETDDPNEFLAKVPRP